MTEYEKAQAGYLYDANYDEELAVKRAECAEKCFDFNNARPSDFEGQRNKGLEIALPITKCD